LIKGYVVTLCNVEAVYFSNLIIAQLFGKCISRVFPNSFGRGHGQIAVRLTWQNFKMNFKLPNNTEHLVCEKHGSVDSTGMFCVALSHNEAHILLQFLEHHRSIGIKNFIVVNDNSTDETAEILDKQTDVTVYKPKIGSSYKRDKIAWRCDLLDLIADQNWVLLPDIDEHFIYPNMDRCDVDCFADQIESEGAEALFTIMVDMYADKPLKEHNFDSGNLIEAFPYFDNPSDPQSGYRLLPPAKRFLKNFPTPPVCAYGGVRDRIFISKKYSFSFIHNWALHKFAHIRSSLTPKFFQKLTNSLTRRITKKHFGPEPFSMTKLGLVKWQKGMRFSGGPHAVSKKLILSQATGAFLHYKFTKGIEGIEYVAKRGQHDGDSVLYKRILNQLDLFDQSPLCEKSLRFTGAESLIDCGLVRAGSHNSCQRRSKITPRAGVKKHHS
jgi:glycosyltransferase involved in cell wall biosynthesis